MSAARTVWPLLLVLAWPFVAQAEARPPAEALVVVLLDAGQPDQVATARDGEARLVLARADVPLLGAAEARRRAALASWGVAGPPDAGRWEQVRSDLATARELFFQTDLAAAARLYAPALAALDAHPEWMSDVPGAPAEVLDHALRFARALQRLGRESEVPAAFEAVARRAPRLAPDTVEHPPEVVQSYLTARDRVLGTLTPLVVLAPRALASSPCRVLVDGQAFGEGPRAEGTVASGRHRVQSACGARWSAVHSVLVDGPEAVAVVDAAVDGGLLVTTDGVVRMPDDGGGPGRLAEVAAAVAARFGVREVALVTDVTPPDIRLYAVERAQARLLPVEEVAPTPGGPLPLPPPARKAPTLRPWAWSMLGTGAALVGTAGYFHWAARDETGRINDGEQRLSQRKQDIAGMAACYSLGGAALVSAIVLFVLEPDAPPPVPGPAGP